MPLSETAKATPILPFTPRVADTASITPPCSVNFTAIVDQVFQRGAQPDQIADHERRKLFRNIGPRIGRPFAAALPASESPALRASTRRSNRSCRIPIPVLPLRAASTNNVARLARCSAPRLDGIDPAPLALVEIGRRQEIADGENPGERGADLVRERGKGRLDDAGHGSDGRALVHLAGGNARAALFRRPPFGRPCGAL